MITIQPAPVGNVLSALAPVIYEVTATSTGANPPIIKAQLYINGVAIGALKPQSHYLESSGVYTFRFDFAQALQQYLSNTDTFLIGGNTNTQPAADAANVGFMKKCAFYVVFSVYQSVAPYGIYESSGTTYTSNTIYALNLAVNQFLPEGDIVKYTGTLPLRFLTNAPKTQSIALDEIRYLSFFDTGRKDAGMRIRLFDESGAIIGTPYYYNIGQSTGNLYRVRRLAVGTAHITAIVGSLAAVSHYDVCVVDNITLPSPSPITELFTFSIRRGQCKRWIVRFLNIFGADDCAEFEFYEQRSATQSQGFLANVPSYPTASLRGLTTLNSRGNVSITLSKKPVPKGLAFWYYELRNSVVLLLHEEGDYATPTAVVVDKETEGVLGGTGTGGTIDVEIPLLYANTDYSHSN